MDESKLSTEQILLMDWVLAPEQPTAVSPAPAATPRRPIREREQRATSWRPEFQPEFYAVPGTEVAPADVATSARMAAVLAFCTGLPVARPGSPGDGVRAIAHIGRAYLIRFRPLVASDPAIAVLDIDWMTTLSQIYGGNMTKTASLIDKIRTAYGLLINWQIGGRIDSLHDVTGPLSAIFAGLRYQGAISDGEARFMIHHINACVALPQVYLRPNLED